MPTCFVIMPITTPPEVREVYRDADHFTHVLEHLFTPALSAAGYDVIPPAAAGSDVIQGMIIKNLDEADLVLCDMSALNANVFFELGIRTALDKPVATVRDDNTPTIPFDHSIVNCHTYDGRLEPWNLDSEVEALKRHVEACLDRAGGANTLWKYFGVEASARVGSAGTSDEDKLDYVVRQIEDLRRDVGGREVLVPPEVHSPQRFNVDAGPLHVVESVEEPVATFLDAAWDVGRSFGAEFVAYVLGPREVHLDFGSFGLATVQIRRIADLATGAGIDLVVSRGDGRLEQLFSEFGHRAATVPSALTPVAWSLNRYGTAGP